METPPPDGPTPPKSAARCTWCGRRLEAGARCRKCPVRRQRLRNNVVLFALLWFFVLTAGRTATRPVTGAEATASFLICAASLYLLIVVHEVGHALAAGASRFRVTGIRVGQGPVLVARRLLGVDVALHLFPSGGWTFHRVEWGRLYRIRRLVTAAAGVVANAAVVVFAVTNLSGRWELTLVLTNVTTIFGNLRPHRFRDAEGRLRPSDGALMLALLRSPSWRLECETSPTVRLVAAHLMAGRSAEALAVLDAGTTTIDHPEIAALLRGSALSDQGRAAEAAGICRELLARRRFPKELRSSALNGLSFACYALDDPSVLAEADAASTAALRLEPDSAAILDTRALILIALGRPAEALPLARRSCSKERNLFTRARAQTTVAMALAGTGDLDEAGRFLDGAAAVLPADDWQLARARHAVAAGASAA